MTALAGGVAGFLVGVVIVYLLALAAAQRRRGGVLTPSRTPTRSPAPAKLVPLRRDHHPDCSSRTTRWCDCKGLPREVPPVG